MSKRVSVSEAIEFRRAIKASDVLRERAVQCAVDEASGDARMMGALADLLDACAIRQKHTNGADSYACAVCDDGWGWTPDNITHDAGCALAAAEAEITGATK